MLLNKDIKSGPLGEMQGSRGIKGMGCGARELELYSLCSFVSVTLPLCASVSLSTHGDCKWYLSQTVIVRSDVKKLKPFWYKINAQ